jgi:hypothetical protein
MTDQNRSHEPIIQTARQPGRRQKLKPPAPESPAQRALKVHGQIGNRAVQRVLAQRSGDGSFELDDDTTGRINSQRGGGQPLDVGVQQHMQAAMGYDFSTVRVHTSNEAASLSNQVQAKAFTTGSDIFFNEGAYQPASSGGQELIAHELTHVVQQGSGMVDTGGSGMTVNAPGDAHEQQADAAARQAVSGEAVSLPGVQRESLPEEEEWMQAKPLDRQEMTEDEELLQGKALQREGLPEAEEEELQLKPVQAHDLDTEAEL